MIYRIHPITKKYLCLHIDGKEARKALGEDTDFNLDPSPVAYSNGWKNMKVEFFDDDEGADTIPDIAMRVGKLFLSQKAYLPLKEMLAPHGEFLPVTHREGEGVIFNCLDLAEKYQALNEKLSMHDPLNDRYSIVFDEDKLRGVNIFKCDVDLSGIFCSDLIKTTVERERLTGIFFSNDVGSPFPFDIDRTQMQ